MAADGLKSACEALTAAEVASFAPRDPRGLRIPLQERLTLISSLRRAIGLRKRS